MRNGRGYGRGCGTGKGNGRGGAGGGRGQRMGQGRGGGRGMGWCQGMSPPAGIAFSTTKPRKVTREAKAFEEQTRDRTKQLGGITYTLAELEASGADSPASERPEATVCSNERPTFPKMNAVVDKDNCSCCGLCVDICPEGAITMNIEATVDTAKCTGCGTCVDECPSQAISLSDAVQRAALQQP
jgi:ferredoxin